MYFQRIREHFAIMGISKAYLVEDKHQLNPKVLFGFFSLSFIVIIESLSLFLHADGFRAYTESAYITSITIFSLFSFMLLIVKSKQLFELIDTIEESMAETKSK